ASSIDWLPSIVRMGDVMIFSTVSLPRLLLVETARRTISVSVTIPISFFPFFTNREPTFAAFIFLAALTTDTLGPTVFSCFFIIFSTVDMFPPPLSSIVSEPNLMQDVQNGLPATPQANQNRRRTLRGTLRILMS